MSLRDDAERATRAWRANPRDRLHAELLALGRCFVPHADNNNFRKIMLMILTGTWVAVTLGLRTTPDFSTLLYLVLTALVFTIVGRQWGLEVNGIVPQVEIGRANDQSDNDD